MNYAEKLKDPRWQKKRLKIMERDEFRCCNCLDEESTLVVHHLKYSGEPWEVEDNFLITLCESCHEEYHTMYKKAIEELEEAILKNHKNILPTIYDLIDFFDIINEDIDKTGYSIDIEKGFKSILMYIVNNEDSFMENVRNMNKELQEYFIKMGEERYGS